MADSDGFAGAIRLAVGPARNSGSKLSGFVERVLTIAWRRTSSAPIVENVSMSWSKSSGAPVNILHASRKAFVEQTSLPKTRPLSRNALASDETSVRVGRGAGFTASGSMSPTISQRPLPPELFELPRDPLPLQPRQPLNPEDTVELVDLVLQADREQPVGLLAARGAR
jgi:hypothetical protein